MTTVKENTFKAKDTMPNTRVVMADFAEEIEEQRDELLEAAKTCEEWMSHRCKHDAEPRKSLRVAIAKATGNV